VGGKEVVTICRYVNLLGVHSRISRVSSLATWCYSVLQCVAACCSVLQRVVARMSSLATWCCSVVQYVVTCCSAESHAWHRFRCCVAGVLQCIAVWCSVLQCVAGCCSV